MNRTRLFGTLALLVFALVACGPGASASPSAPATPPATSPSAAPSPSDGASPSASPTEDASPTDDTGAVTVMVAESELGEILVDAEGRTLYAFTDDTNGEPTCAGDCATAWPPLTVAGEVTVGEGLDDSDFSTVDATTGDTQVKVGDWPLYYFAQDSAPGDTNGQGVGDKWYVVSPSGELIR
jgi:predicted lipoprotein with Yx(FWY)xxD motif